MINYIIKTESDATAGVGSSQNNIDQTNVSRTGITYNSDVESLINYNSSTEKIESRLSIITG